MAKRGLGSRHQTIAAIIRKRAAAGAPRNAAVDEPKEIR